MTTETIEEKIEHSRTELLDLSLRNPLVNYRLLRAKGVEAAKCDSSKVFKSLVREHRADAVHRCRLQIDRRQQHYDW